MTKNADELVRFGFNITKQDFAMLRAISDATDVPVGALLRRAVKQFLAT